MSECENLAMRDDPRATASAMLAHEGGLHARPAIKVVQLAKRYAAQVWIGLAANGPWIDAKSIARVMAMKTPNHTLLYFAAAGRDADAAVNALAQLVSNDFTIAPTDAG
jgi:phosphocarrier protein HPr